MTNKEMQWGQRLAHNGAMDCVLLIFLVGGGRACVGTHSERVHAMLTDKKIRDKTVQVLQAFLSKQVRSAGRVVRRSLVYLSSSMAVDDQ